ncbi:MAG: hypothetical protein IPM97_03185 [Bdellovibrionaceae bacterium]|nr:hypothetical protein [Pseudobdellovibrionaceae bacterium]
MGALTLPTLVTSPWRPTSILLFRKSTNGTAAGQMWYDAGTIKYYDGLLLNLWALQGQALQA